tara:strand:- start:118 stop:354 length:237 start_codon:yes stop_codon:yes gene_type:complete
MSRAELWDMMPKNPKKALILYKKLYPTLSIGAPTPTQVLEGWRNIYGESKNIKAFIKEIVYFVYNNWTMKTSEKIKEQ